MASLEVDVAGGRFVLAAASRTRKRRALRQQWQRRAFAALSRQTMEDEQCFECEAAPRTPVPVPRNSPWTPVKLPPGLTLQLPPGNAEKLMEGLHPPEEESEQKPATLPDPAAAPSPEVLAGVWSQEPAKDAELDNQDFYGEAAPPLGEEKLCVDLPPLLKEPAKVAELNNQDSFGEVYDRELLMSDSPDGKREYRVGRAIDIVHDVLLECALGGGRLNNTRLTDSLDDIWKAAITSMRSIGMVGPWPRPESGEIDWVLSMEGKKMGIEYTWSDEEEWDDEEEEEEELCDECSEEYS